jgi:hypothetical protein
MIREKANCDAVYLISTPYSRVVDPVLQIASKCHGFKFLIALLSDSVILYRQVFDIAKTSRSVVVVLRICVRISVVLLIMKSTPHRNITRPPPQNSMISKLNILCSNDD